MAYAAAMGWRSWEDMRRRVARGVVQEAAAAARGRLPEEVRPPCGSARGRVRVASVRLTVTLKELQGFGTVTLKELQGYTAHTSCSITHAVNSQGSEHTGLNAEGRAPALQR